MNFYIRKYIVFGLIALLLATFSFKAKADTKFTASASSTTVAVGEQIQITFELNGNGRNFQTPNFANFSVLSGPSQSSSMQIYNGSMTQTLSFTYIIQSTKEGIFKIGPAFIEANGQKVQSNILTITVLKGNNKPQSQGSAQQKGGGNEVDAAMEKNVFLKASIDKSNVYRGQGIVVTYKLYTRVQLVNYQLSKLPALEGFFSQEIPMSQQPQFRGEVLNGVKYNVADIKKVVLFPQRTGSLSVDPMKGEVIARVQVKRKSQGRNPFEDFFNDPFFGNNAQDIKVELSSETLKVNVKDLPSSAPSTFNGAVGKFTMTATVDKKEVKAHDAINLKIKVTGKGNIKLIDPPKIDFPPDFETYDPKVNSNATVSENGVNGTKTFEYLIIPRNAGEYKILVNGLSFFDLEKNKYETLPGNEFVLKIGKGDETVTTTVSGVSKSDVQFIGKDIRFIKTTIPLFALNQSSFYDSPWFYMLIIIPAILFLLLIIFRKRYMELQSNITLLKSRKANSIAMKRLKIAKKFLSQNNSTEFLDEMFKALWGFVSDKLQIPVSELSKENVSSVLATKNVSPESVKLFIEALDACEMARFAKSIAASNDKIYQMGIDVISKLEEEIG
jgi:BatD DUF11 like domain